jgi:hypothetical protein
MLLDVPGEAIHVPDGDRRELPAVEQLHHGSVRHWRQLPSVGRSASDELLLVLVQRQPVLWQVVRQRRQRVELRRVRGRAVPEPNADRGWLCGAVRSANGYDLIQPDASKNRCCVTCQAKVFSCPTLIAEGCPPSSNCSTAVCGPTSSCPAWDGQRATNCCAYACNGQCLGKWFDNSSNVLNCDVCAGAACQNRTQIEAGCITQFGAGKYQLLQPDSSKRRCCFTCVALNVDITSSSGVDSTSSEVVGSTSSNQEATSSNQDSVSSGDSTSIGNSDSDSGTIIEKTGVDVTTDAASADTVNFAVVREASLALIAVAIAMANL